VPELATLDQESLRRRAASAAQPAGRREPLLLSLQRSAGNQAVVRALRLARQPAAPPAPTTDAAPGRISASVGKGGVNTPADVAVVQGLLTGAGLDATDVGAALERYQRETLGWSNPDGRADPGGRTMRRLAGPPAATNGHAAAPTAPSGASTAAPGTPETHQAPPVSAEPVAVDPAIERQFVEFATARAPLLAAMQGAADDEARRTARVALRAYDAERLPHLRELQAQMGGRWNIADTGARDAVLAAIQLEAATDAEGDLHRNSDEVHKRVAKAAGMGLDSAWCGMFTVDHYRHSGMDSELKSGFLHVDNVHDYFTYNHNRNAVRVPRWIWADHAWHDLHDYHRLRGSERTWLQGSAIGAGGQLDIRPGDTALIDVGRDGTANHIVKVSSYDPATSTLLTIGGNDAGFIVDPNPGKPATGDEKRAEAEAGGNLKKGGWAGGAAGGHVGESVQHVQADGRKPSAIFGIGRPSLVDFEDHRYDHSGNTRKAPAALAE
jgi:hypothetical protein